MRHAFVLVHGLAGFGKLSIRGTTFLPYFRGCEVEIRRTVPGCSVHVPTLPFAASVAQRAEALASVLRSLGDADAVHLIAHSMGGLDARLAVHSAHLPRVVSITTLSSPHRGSPVAEWYAQPGRVGTSLLSGAASLLRIDVSGLQDLTPAGAEAFSAATPNLPDVACFSLAGCLRPGRVQPYLLPTAHYLARHHGPSDGLVTVASARWGCFLGEVPADHMELVGWRFPAHRAWPAATWFGSHAAQLAAAVAHVEAGKPLAGAGAGSGAASAVLRSVHAALSARRS